MRSSVNPRSVARRSNSSSCNWPISRRMPPRPRWRRRWRPQRRQARGSRCAAFNGASRRAVRCPAARTDRLSGAVGVPVLRRHVTQARRGRDRDAGGRATAVEGDRARAREVLLPLLRGDHPAAGALASDRARAVPARACAVRQVRAAPAAPSPERRLCARRHRARRLDAGRLGRRFLGNPDAAGRGDPGTRVRSRAHPCRRAEPIESLEAGRHSDPVRLAAIDPKTPNSGEPGSASAEPLGLIALGAREGELWRKWRGVQHEIRMESELLALCRASPGDCPSAPARRLLAMIETARTRQGRARLGEINRAINLSIRPMSDLAQYGVVDLWSSPLATLAAGAGDCEDYAIAKYVALREAGLGNEDLRLLIVRDTKLREDHAVVAARLDGRWLVLDNRRLVLLEDMQLKQYAPMFEIDD